MSSGMEWFRWYHGSVTDPKFALIAKRSGSRLGDVIALWAFLLEQSSASDCRGEIGMFDMESVELLLDLQDGQCMRILDAMCARGLITDHRIARWEKRQPKRERPDDTTAAERKRAQRERDAAVKNGSDENGVTADVTPCHTMSHHVTPRGEESRQDKDNKTLSSPDESDDHKLPACPHQKIIALYGSILPELPQPRIWEGAAEKALSARWRWLLTASKPNGTRYAETADEGLDWFKRMFEYVRGSDFLMGSGSVSRQWSADLRWIVKAENFAKIISGNYHKDAQ